MKLEHFSKLVTRECKVCHKSFEGSRREQYCGDSCKAVQRNSNREWKRITAQLIEVGHEVKKQKDEYVITVNPSHFKNHICPEVRIPTVLPTQEYALAIVGLLRNNFLKCDLREVTVEIIVDELPDEVLSYVIAMYTKCDECSAPMLKSESICPQCKHDNLPF